MKFLPVIITILIAPFILLAQNVGINTALPKAMLHVKDSNVLFTGGLWYLPFSPGNPPVSGEGVRLMWYPDKAALRVGAVSGSFWDKDNVGKYSFAQGLDCKATNDFSTAFGVNNNSLNLYSFTSGVGNTAEGPAGIAMGSNNVAKNTGSVAIGSNLIARSLYGFVFGYNNDTSDLQLGIGSGQPDDRIFQIGNGAIIRKNALTILRNGNTGIGALYPTARFQVDSSVLFTGNALANNASFPAPAIEGKGTRMLWYPEKGAVRFGTIDDGPLLGNTPGGYPINQWDKNNIGRFSIAAGYNTIASNQGNMAVGLNTTASGLNGAVAIGNYTTANGEAALSTGYNTKAEGGSSVSMGYYTTASGFGSIGTGYFSASRGDQATTMGSYTIARSVNSLVIGKYNDTTNTNRLFEIGNGTSNSGRNNAVTVLTNGNVGIGNANPAKPLSFPPALGEKILLYPGGTGEVGIGVYGNELRIHSDYAAAKISFGFQDNVGNFTQTMWLNNTTSVLTVGGTAYPSDERYKKQITPISDPIKKVMALNGVDYFMRTDDFPEMNFSKNLQTGLIAQQVEKVMPSAVYEINEKGYKGVDYAKLVPLLIEAIKMQEKRIEELEKKAGKK